MINFEKVRVLDEDATCVICITKDRQLINLSTGNTVKSVERFVLSKFGQSCGQLIIDAVYSGSEVETKTKDGREVLISPDNIKHFS